jgi:hypothetical protein
LRSSGREEEKQWSFKLTSNTAAFIVASHEGPTWDREVGRPAVFKLLSDQTEGRLAVFEEIVPPRLGTPLHIHQISDEAIYVVSGQFSSGWARQLTPHWPVHGYSSLWDRCTVSKSAIAKQLNIGRTSVRRLLANA